MAATHCVSLFLPFTIEWAAGLTAQQIVSPSPAHLLEEPVELPRRAVSQGNLSAALNGLVLHDSEVAKQSKQERLNQPHSSAEPLPSSSILDFARPSTASRNAISVRGFEKGSWKVQSAVQGNHALVNAINSIKDASKKEISWVGTLAFPTDALSAALKTEIAGHLANEYQSDVVYLSDKDTDGHYTHFCKTILWPIFHYQVHDHLKSKAYADNSWKFYVNVNQAFADKVVYSYKTGDTIWVHDYHLLLVPGMVRKILPDAQIGFFLHTPFPSSEIFRCLSKRKQLLEGMLGANLVAFQIQEYADHFLQTCSRILAVETTSEGVQLESHFVNVTCAPIGLSPEAFRKLRQLPGIHEWIAKIKARWENKKLIVAIDKFDQIQGIRQKLLGFERFLQQYPEWVNRVVLIQVVIPTSPQTEMLASVYDVCTRIETRYHTIQEESLIFFKQDIDMSQRIALLSAADVVINTALRNGMGLTAHEYIYCQDGTMADNKHGPLILSEFTGSALVFDGGHLSVNPWDLRELSAAIKHSLEMDASEKARRWSHLHRVVQSLTGEAWAAHLDASLARVHEAQSLRASASVPRLSTALITDKYAMASRRVFFLDFEGTLSPPKTPTGLPISSQQQVVDTLNDLILDPANVVYVMSCRTTSEIEAAFRTTAGLGLIAENGCFIRAHGVGQTEWHSPVDLDEMKKWKSEVRNILKYYTTRMERSSIENRTCSIILRYDKVQDQEAAVRMASDCAEQINSTFNNTGVQAVPIAKAVLIEQADFTKATAAKQIFERLVRTAQPEGLAAPSFLAVAGDDREDEVVFRWANDLGRSGQVRDVFTISVGKRNTEAQATLTQGSAGLLAVLQKLARISMDAAHMA